MRYITIDNNGRIISNSSIYTDGSIPVNDGFDCIGKLYNGSNWVDDIPALKENKKDYAKSFYKDKKIKELYDSDYKKIEKDIDDCTTKEEIENIEVE